MSATFQCANDLPTQNVFFQHISSDGIELVIGENDTQYAIQLAEINV